VSMTGSSFFMVIPLIAFALSIRYGSWPARFGKDEINVVELIVRAKFGKLYMNRVYG